MLADKETEAQNLLTRNLISKITGKAFSALDETREAACL